MPVESRSGAARIGAPGLFEMSDEEIIKFAREFREGILDGRASQGFCYAICAPLAPLLALNGVPCDIEEGAVGPINHYWLRLRDDGRILDPTADQFPELRLPRVYLGVKPSQYGDNRAQQCLRF